MTLRATKRAVAIAAMGALLAACSEAQLAVTMTKKIEEATENRARATSGNYKVGDPYQIEGVWYTPREDFAYDEQGVASWYGPGFDGKRTANGDTYDQNALTAAHPTLQMPSKVQVTNLENGRSLALIVNDRGPYRRGRILDVSRRAAQLLGFDGNGTAKVRVRILPEESLQLAALAGRKGAAPILVARADGAPKAMPRGEVLATPLPSVAVAGPAPVTAAQLASAPPPLITTERVRPTSIYVQAGAFTQQANAERLRARLAGLGRAQISQFRQGSQNFYRVRVGPLANVDEADRTLGRIVASGQSDARVVVD
jgi:rare lipoprotein A